MYDVMVVGGGLAGMTSAFLMAKSGLKILLLEKGSYPQHRVCGEYVSNEVLPFLKKHGLFPSHINTAKINKFQLTSTNGRSVEIPLILGAFGISRYAFDTYLYERCLSVGVEFLTHTKVSKIKKKEDYFELSANEITYKGHFVIGAYGKRANLDKLLNRDFMNLRSPYIGVKYHVKTEFPDDLIALHNFENGYCGVSKIENNTYNICYLSHRDNLKNSGTISAMETSVLFQNPYLKTLFLSSDFLFDKPLIINEISFTNKKLIEDNILMCGDTAGLITPLCGNGMSMAIHAGKIAAETLTYFRANPSSRAQIEQTYEASWNQLFKSRLHWGRQLQRVFGNKMTSNLVVNLAKIAPSMANKLVSKTHGHPF